MVCRSPPGSQIGVGSTFQVRLPYVAVALADATAAVATRQPAASHGPPLAGLRLLAAEDNAVNRMVLEEQLLDQGCDLELVGDGRQAVAAVRRAGPGGFDLVLMDVQMPVLSGLDASREIHAIDPTLPVVGQTAHALAEEHEKCRQAGMIEWLTKPLDPDQLVATIARLARRRQP